MFLLSCRVLTQKRLPFTTDLNLFYCSVLGGSLYNVLEEPEYIYGLKETDLKKLIKDVTSGMSYLREKVSQKLLFIVNILLRISFTVI